MKLFDLKLIEFLSLQIFNLYVVAFITEITGFTDLLSLLILDIDTL